MSQYGPPGRVDHFEPAALTVAVDANSPLAAIEAVELEIDSVLDDISFQIQSIVKICQLEILDVSAPIAVGDEREILLYPFSGGYQLPKFQGSIFQSNVLAQELPFLRWIGKSALPKTKTTLRWYVKALAADTDISRFMFHWIALEILIVSETDQLRLPYRAPCGHEIPECPECGRETHRRMSGAEMQSHLVETFGVSLHDAKLLWETRMMFHGANDLTEEALKDLARLTALCWGLAATALKRALGFDDHSVPIVAQQAVGFNCFHLRGCRTINAVDPA